MPANQEKISAKFYLLLRTFFKNDPKWQARGLFLALVVLALTILRVNVYMNELAGEVFRFLELREEELFHNTLLIYLLMFGVSTLVTVLQSYCEQRTALFWRMKLSRHFLDKYFSNKAFYKIAFLEGIDNPDQRLEEDVRSFTTTTLSLFLILFNAFLTILSFVYILSNISTNLVIAVFAYALVGSLIAYLLGRPLIGLNFTQLKREADYRYKLVNVRDNAESIAFLRGEKKESIRARQRLKRAVQNFRRIISVNRNLSFFITFYNNLKPVLPLIIVSPLYLSGEVKDLGVVTRSVDAFVRSVEALSVLIQHFGTISGLAAVVTRLGAFSQALDQAADSSKTAGQQTAIKTLVGPTLIFNHVTVATPQRDQNLIRDLSFELKSGGLLIVGGSGNGKSSILRVISGLWSSGEGQITRPDLNKSIFLPQRPYLVLGSLRNQLLYCSRKRAVTDEELLRVLQLVDLDKTVERVGGLDAMANWGSLLSAGEQQQLAFARLLLAKPEHAFLDEATTAVHSATEALLYDLVTRNTVSFVSVGYRASLSRYHRMILEIRDDGAWHLEQQARGK